MSKRERTCAAHLWANVSGRYRLSKRADHPFKIGYDPELDISPALEPDALSCFQTVINVLRWMIKLGRIDIINKVSLLLLCIALPREGHLGAAVHVTTQVGQTYNFRLVYDPSYPEIDHSVFKKHDWSEFYCYAEEAVSINAPEP